MRTSRLQQELSGKLGDFWKADAEKKVARAKEEFNTKMTVDANGVVRNCIGRIIMADMVELLTVAGCEFNAEATNKTREEENAVFMEEYRKNQKPASQEELYEMRSAFGAGTTVVDVISSRVTKL